MFFVENKVAFGRHETFQLRYSWLTKGFQELKDPAIFTAGDATVKLGVGKNMVNSIRYWLQAAQLAEPCKAGYQATEIGEAIFGEKGHDPYLEDEATIWLIHWLLCSNPTLATSWYWYFNYFHKPEFTNKEVVDSLQQFAKQKITAKVALATLKKDIDIILRMYTRSSINAKKTLEDALDSPLALLNLITRLPHSTYYHSFAEEKNRIPLGIIGFAVACIFQQSNTNAVPIENLMYMKGNHPALGAIFRMTESALLTKLEQLEHAYPTTWKVSESAGIHQLTQLDTCNPFDYLTQHYKGALLEEAA